MDQNATDRPRPAASAKELGGPGDMSEEAGDHPHEQRDRIAALAGLAAEAGYPSSSPTTTTPLSPVVRTRWRRRVVLGLLVLIVIAGAGYGLLMGLRRIPAGNTANIPGVITLDLTQTPLRCPAGFVWSPNGRQLTVWGPSLGCQDDSARPLAIIFDAATARVVQTIDMSSLIPARYTRANNFGAIISFAWSPDGKALVAALVLGSQTAPLGLTQYGLLRMPLDGSQAAFYGPSQPVPQDAVLLTWNIHNGAFTFTSAGLPPALSYEWTADIHILPSEQASGGRSAPSNGFTVWQDGQISPAWGASLSNGPPAAEVFTASPVLWSPDGQEMVVGTSSPSDILHGVVALASSPVDSTICAQLNLSTPCQPTVLPPPDAAFSAVMQALAQPVRLPAPEDQMYAGYLGAGIAWSANGKALATVLPLDQFTSANTTHTIMTVLSTASGKPVAHYTYQCPLPNGCGNNLVPSWSPTGTQLGAFDSEAETITLWNTTTLGR